MVRFIVCADLDFDLEKPDTYVILPSADINDFLKWLGFEPTDFGCLDASEVAARCRRRLWPLPRNFDEAVPPKRVRKGQVAYEEGGRAAGYLRAKTEELLRLTSRAGPAGAILFS